MSTDLHSVQVVPHPDDVASENAREQRNNNSGGGLQLPSYRNTASSPFPQTHSGGPTPQSASGYFNSDFENENLSPCNLADFPDPDGGSVGSELRGAAVSSPTGAPSAGPTAMSHPSAFRPPPPVPALQTHESVDQYSRAQHRYLAASSTNQQHTQHQAEYMSSSGPDQLFTAANNAPPTNHSMSHNESYDNLSMPDTFWDVPVGVDHVNWLMSYCQIVRREEPITSLKQCTSSLFVLVFQRIFNCNIENIELDPNTHEKRLHNIQRVLEELEANILSASGDHVSLSHISAEEIVLVNEDHIAMLVQVFLDIAQAVMRHAQFDRAGGAGVGSGATRGATSNGHHPYTMNYNSANGGGAGAGGVGGVGVPPLRQQLLDDIASEVSAADSADKTQQLVSKWQLELVHPIDQRGGGPAPKKAIKVSAPSLDEEMLNLRRRMLHFDELLTTPTKGRRSSALIDASRISTPHHGKPSIGSQSSIDYPKSRQTLRATHTDPTAGTGMMTVQKIRGGTISRAATGRSSSRGISATNNKKKRGATPSRQLIASSGPYVPASTYATFPPDTYHMARTLDTEARDHKIEQLRSLKFIQETCATVRADIVTKASEKQAAIAASNKEYAKRKARDLRDIKCLIKDEDDRYKQAYKCIMTSARNDLERYGDVVDRHSRHVFTRNQAAIAEAEKCAVEAKEQQEDFISNRTRKYSRAVSGWRSGTIAAA